MARSLRRRDAGRDNRRAAAPQARESPALSAPLRRSLAAFVLVAALVSIGSAGAAFPGVNGALAYSGNDGEIHAMFPDGTNDRILTSDPAPDQSPAWAPDGQRLAFASFRSTERARAA